MDTRHSLPRPAGASMLRLVNPSSRIPAERNRKYTAKPMTNEHDTVEHYTLQWPGKSRAIDNALSAPLTRLEVTNADNSSPPLASTPHVFIEGDNLEALKLLRPEYLRKVKMIYIDPPYNTGKKFIYPDNFCSPDAAGSRKSPSARHSDWLNMMYPRLLVARDILRPDGVFFVSIDDNEVHNLRIIMDEIFGPENFLAHIVWQHSVQPKGYAHTYSVHHNHILSYRKSDAHTISQLERSNEDNKAYSNPDNDPKGDWRHGDVRNSLFRQNLRYDITTPSGKRIAPPKNGWRWSQETLQGKIETGEIFFSQDEDKILRKIYLANQNGRTPETIWYGKDVGVSRDGAKELKSVFGGLLPFDTVKPMALIDRMMQVAGITENDLVLDFFAGSCTTAHAVVRSGRGRFIVVQSPEPVNASLPHGKAALSLHLKTIADIGKARVKYAMSSSERNDSCAFYKIGQKPD